MVETIAATVPAQLSFLETPLDWFKGTGAALLCLSLSLAPSPCLAGDLPGTVAAAAATAITTETATTTTTTTTKTQTAVPAPRVTARSAILYDRVTGEVLFDKASREISPPASTTKILTAIVAIEMGNLDQEVVISKKASSVGGSSNYLRAGEVLSVEDLLWGALLESGNDSCVALAEAVAGSEALFVEMMNKKAALLGATDTDFKNTNGLPNKNHLTTAHDMAVIADYALSNPLFAKIVSTKHAEIPQKDTTRRRSLDNTNRLLSTYKGANGVKTGTTNAAGQCLVSSAIRGDRQLIAVVLKSGNRYGDSVKLLDHGFEDYFVYSIPQGTQVGTLHFEKADPCKVDLVTGKNLSFAVSVTGLGEYEKALTICKGGLPLKKGHKVGYLEIKANKQYRIPVVVAETVEERTTSDWVKRIFRSVNEEI